MFEVDENWVPKIHPATRPVEEEDPMMLVAEAVAGDPIEMVDSFVQEFAWMGWSAEEIFHLFQSPAYPVLQQLMVYFGEEEIRRRIADRLARCGVLRFEETIVEDPEESDEDHGPPLVQISLGLPAGPCG